MYKIFFELANVIGICGVSFILTAFFMLSTGRWMATQLSYQIFNFSGAWLILFSLFFHWNLSSVLIEIAWIMISSIGICRTLGFSLRKKAKASLPCNSSECADSP